MANIKLDGSVLEVFQAKLRMFARERDWEQYHTPKNLVMALTVEAAELQEHFQWLTPEQSQALSAEKQAAVAAEMADIFLYLLRLADQLSVDLVEATLAKMTLNAQRYPADLVQGSAEKYTAYREKGDKN
jgi:NTP pyrophosphatase (non-canonical NTP hydrolase)